MIRNSYDILFKQVSSVNLLLGVVKGELVEAIWLFKELKANLWVALGS